MSDTTIYEPEIRALLGTAPHFYLLVVLKLRTVPLDTALRLRIIRVNRRDTQAMYKRGVGAGEDLLAQVEEGAGDAGGAEAGARETEGGDAPHRPVFVRGSIYWSTGFRP